MNQTSCKFNRLAGFQTSLFISLAAYFMFAASSALAQSETGIKAAFVYNFAKFTGWPEAAFAGGNAPITVGFVGADSLADMFEQNVAGKNANGRDFAVKRFSSAAGTENCQIVFVGDTGQTAAVIAAAKGKAILTVGDSDGFSDAGGMIRFVKDGAKISFDLNLTSITAAQLKLDAKLRQIARSVKGG
jgi:hypothetical protein